MKKIPKLLLLTILIHIAPKCFSQVFYVKFKTAKYKTPHRCDVYIVGLGDTTVNMRSVNLPSNAFWPLRCDSVKTVNLVVDFWDLTNSTIKGEFHCGDSALVDIDKRVTFILNRKIEFK